MTPDFFSVAANVATILASVVAAISLIVGAIQFVATQKSSRETQAVELFLKFNQLNIDQGLATNSQSDHWYNNGKIAITESLYEVTHGSKSWESTVKWMLSQQEEFICGGDFEVESYSDRFQAFCKNNGYELKLSS